MELRSVTTSRRVVTPVCAAARPAAQHGRVPVAWQSVDKCHNQTHETGRRARTSPEDRLVDPGREAARGTDRHRSRCTHCPDRTGRFPTAHNPFLSHSTLAAAADHSTTPAAGVLPASPAASIISGGGSYPMRYSNWRRNSSSGMPTVAASFASWCGSSKSSRRKRII
jgi:hypothetical protein